MSDYVPLLEALDGHFDKRLDELPDALRKRVLQDLLLPWNSLSPVQSWDSWSPVERKACVEAYDYMHSPATKQLLQSLLQQISVAEPAEQVDDMLERKLALEQEIKEINKIPDSSYSDYELKKRKLAEVKQALDEIDQQLCQARGDYLEVDDDAALSSPYQPVYAAQIISNFHVFKDEDQNKKWWEPKLADADRYHLLECRVGAGRKGRGNKTLWRPDLIAAWLIHRYEIKLESMTPSSARAALKKFHGGAEADDVYLQSDE